MVLKQAPLPEDIVKLGVDGVNKIWRDAKMRGAGMKRAKTLVTAAEHSVGCTEASETARYEIRILLSDFDLYVARESEIVGMINEKIKEIPYIDKLLEIKGIGLKTAVGFVAEVGDMLTPSEKTEQLKSGLLLYWNEYRYRCTFVFG